MNEDDLFDRSARREADRLERKYRTEFILWGVAIVIVVIYLMVRFHHPEL